MRMIIACVVKESEKDLIKPFLEKNKDFESRILPTSDSMQSHLPLKFCFPLTFCIGTVKIYEAFTKWKKQNPEFPKKFINLQVYSKDSIV